MPDLVTAVPQGAFYVFPDVSAHFGKSAPDGTVIGGATDLCLYLLRWVVLRFSTEIQVVAFDWLFFCPHTHDQPARAGLAAGAGWNSSCGWSSPCLSDTRVWCSGGGSASLVWSQRCLYLCTPVVSR